MTTPEFTGYPEGDADQWRRRYEPAVEQRFGDGVDDAAATAVVVVWEQSRELKPCLQSLRQAADGCDDLVELVVVDNGVDSAVRNTTDGLWDRWIRFQSNLGVGPARNLGAAVAAGDIVAFVDDDGTVAPDYFRTALTYFDDDDVVGLRGRVTARNHPYFCTLASHYDRGPDPTWDALITEGASVVRKPAFIDAGGFPDQVYGHEGIELTRRIELCRPQKRTVYAPDVVLRHDYLESWSEFVEKQLRCARNEEDLKQRAPEVSEYLQDYFDTSFEGPALPPTKLAARTGLRLLRTSLQETARLAFRLRDLVTSSSP